MKKYCVMCARRGDQMVKLLTKETLFMNCLEINLVTKLELEHLLKTMKKEYGHLKLENTISSYTLII